MKSRALPLVISKPVATAIRAGRPVVALESTVITHGLPFPANKQTALAMEEAVRSEGAVPATIAVLDGTVRVGLSRREIESLAELSPESVRKCSRRDFPIAIAGRENAATTVAGTMIVAHLAGIRVMATGGIGGVHRGQPHDVSADLMELGRTPVAVVCSGPKSILDLPLTLEVLETQGVPVVGFGADHLPAFYSRDSGLGVDARADSAGEAAAIVAASRLMGLAQGVLITVPVPGEHELPFAKAEAAIAAATREAGRKAIRGKALTPFLLRRIAQLSKGTSLRANVALLENNARVGARIAAALARLEARRR